MQITGIKTKRFAAINYTFVLRMIIRGSRLSVGVTAQDRYKTMKATVFSVVKEDKNYRCMCVLARVC